MKIRLNVNVLGLHIAALSVDLDLDLDGAEAAPVADRVTKAASRPVKGLSRLWVKGMMA
ncbi:hypothetical protein I5H09_gp043 [Mycobacterium phage Yunkel11]|uniref:Uncharacterized protein n=1 Tax=Mycobacterium phage Yunkel11 TaxID=2599886 RepID=A0A5J6TFD3_9CAUD|nr:hypothetical protein I5H09_gp043 [Mycobacterium phage Yunkel11]QFG08449.1 hypothetical protein SEA_YUNKEL11_63 [Mycobacterium phage Yunkel11]